jgi:AmmeMemoRadiSam system protein A
MNRSNRQPNQPIALAVLMPHAPVLIEPVGGRRVRDVANTVAAMQAVARRVVAIAPEALVLISPHSPRRSGAFGFWGGTTLEGSFEQFGAPETVVRLPNASDLAHVIMVQALAHRLRTWEIHAGPLDHGALVPLWFIGEAGWRGPTVVISLNHPQEGGLFELGEAIAAAATQQQQRIAVIASGDMSHSLQPGAPAGYHPRAKEFDRQFIELLRAGRFRETNELDARLREEAAEDVVDSTVIGAASALWRTNGHEVLSYEGPFGVGYGVAVLFDAVKAGHDDEDGHGLPRIARESVEAVFRGTGQSPSPVASGYLAQQLGVFVTIRRRDGELRGCIGTFQSKCRDLVEETRHVAREAAFDDIRFKPVKPEELANLCFEVSVVHDLEPVDSSADLDPARYGVLVSTSDGRRGALLPGIPEITTVEAQLRIARQKGHIEEHELIRLQRFQVDHFDEESETTADERR